MTPCQPVALPLAARGPPVDADLLTLRAAPDLDPLTTRAAPMGEPSTLDEKTRSTEYTLLTENMATVYAPEIDEVVDEVVIAAGVEWPESVRLLADHEKNDIDKVRGSVRNFRREGSVIVGRAYFAEDADSEKAWIKVKGGHLPSISAGYRVIEASYINPGETMIVAGRSFTARSRTLRVATKVMMREDSLVAVPADIFATVRHTPTNRGTPASEDHMKKKFRAWLIAKGLNPDAIDETARKAHFDQYVTERKAAGDTSADGEGETDTERAAGRQPTPAPGLDATAMKAAADAAAASALTTERARIAAIEDLAGNDEALADTCRQAIREGWDTARATAEFLKKTRESRGNPVGAPAIHVAAGATADSLGAMLTMRGGRDIVADAGDNTDRRNAATKLAEQGHKFRDLALIDVCRHAILLDGKSIPHSRDDTIRSAISGGTLTNIFTQSISAVLLGAFNEAGDSTLGLCSEEEVPDFKTNDRIRAGEVGNLKRLPRGGTAQHADMADSKESYKIARFAEQMVFDEQDIIDDNFGILRQQGTQLGSAAKRLRPDLVYAILMNNAALGVDSVALFHTTHANIATGGGSVLSDSSLQTAITAISIQTGVRAEVILNLMAKNLVVAPALKFTAAKLLKSSEVREGRGGTAAAAQGTYNALQDEGLAMRTEQRIQTGFKDPTTGAAITGAATKWFLFGDPAACPTVEVGYRRGTGRAPTLRSFVLDRGRWGIGFDVNFDIGAKALDFRNMYYSAGA